MEAKKTPKADLQRKRVLFFEIGMIFSLAVVVLAFGCNKQEDDEIFTVGGSGSGGGPIAESVPVTREPPKGTTKPQKKIQQSMDIIRIVLDETKIIEEINFNEFDADAIFADGTEIGPVGIGTGGPGDGSPFTGDEVFDVVEDMPKFMGKDINAFQPWVQSKVVYPNKAINQEIQGRIMVSFIVEKDGSLSNIVATGGDPILMNEAIRVVKTSPKWTPGRQRNRPAKVKITIPVNFRLV